MPNTQPTRSELHELPTFQIRDTDSVPPPMNLASAELRDESERFWYWLYERAPFARICEDHVRNERRVPS
jgi:hypothetical protein